MGQSGLLLWFGTLCPSSFDAHSMKGKPIVPDNRADSGDRDTLPDDLKDILVNDRADFLVT